MLLAGSHAALRLWVAAALLLLPTPSTTFLRPSIRTSFAFCLGLIGRLPCKWRPPYFLRPSADWLKKKVRSSNAAL